MYGRSLKLTTYYTFANACYHKMSSGDPGEPFFKYTFWGGNFKQMSNNNFGTTGWNFTILSGIVGLMPGLYRFARIVKKILDRNGGGIAIFYFFNFFLSVM